MPPIYFVKIAYANRFRVPFLALTNICSTAKIELRDKNTGGENIREYFEASTLPTPEEAAAAQKICCGRVCSMCESPAEYAWRKRTVDLSFLVRDAVEHDLDEGERKTVEQYWFEDMTLTEIAAETGRAPPNVARTLRRAHQKLYTVLRHAVQYQYNLESGSLTPLAVRKALATAAADKMSDTFTYSIGERLKGLRRRDNIPVQKLAEIIGIPESRLLAIEKSKILPDTNELLLIAAFFDTTTDFLLKGEM